MRLWQRKIAWLGNGMGALQGLYTALEWILARLGDFDLIWSQSTNPTWVKHVLRFLSDIPAWVPILSVMACTAYLWFDSRRRFPEKERRTSWPTFTPRSETGLRDRLQLKFLTGSEKYHRLRNDGWRTYAMGLQNNSELRPLRGVRVRLIRINPVPTALRGSLPLPMRFRDHERSVREIEIRPGSIEYVDMISVDQSPSSVNLRNFKIEHTSDAPLHVMGSDNPEMWRFSSDENISNQYEFDLEITAEAVTGRITETFIVRIDRENDKVELIRQNQRR